MKTTTSPQRSRDLWKLPPEQLQKVLQQRSVKHRNRKKYRRRDKYPTW